MDHVMDHAMKSVENEANIFQLTPSKRGIQNRNALTVGILKLSCIIPINMCQPFFFTDNWTNNISFYGAGYCIYTNQLYSLENKKIHTHRTVPSPPRVTMRSIFVCSV